MSSYRVVSSDSHVFEPADLWTTRIEPRFRDRCPRIIHTDRGDWWPCDGLQGQGVGAGAQAGFRFEDPGKLSHVDALENVRPGGYIPEQHVKDMDLDGIDVGLVYPTAGLHHYKVVDSELLDAVFTTYNDWIADFCSAYPHRLKGIGMINIDDVPEGVLEMQRCARMGLAGVMMPVFLPDGKSYASPEYERLWAAAQDLRIPLGLHAGTHRSSSNQEFQLPQLMPFYAYVNLGYSARVSLADIISSGVFERYPQLRVGAVEFELTWVPYFLEQMDYTYTQRPPGDNWIHFKEDARPSDFFYSNVYLSFQESSLGIRLRDVIGVDNMLWGSDYPHFESTFPKSREILEELLSDCTDEEKTKIAGGNAARVYNLE